MVEEMRSFFSKENHAMLIFLGAQAVALAAGAGAVIAYSVRLETRVHIMETRGAEYTVDRMNKFDQRITILEGNMKDNKDRIDRILNELLKDQQRLLK